MPRTLQRQLLLYKIFIIKYNIYTLKKKEYYEYTFGLLSQYIKRIKINTSGRILLLWKQWYMYVLPVY